MHQRTKYKFNNSARYIFSVDEHLLVFWPNSYCACAETVPSFRSKF